MKIKVLSIRTFTLEKWSTYILFSWCIINVNTCLEHININDFIVQKNTINSIGLHSKWLIFKNSIYFDFYPYSSKVLKVYIPSYWKINNTKSIYQVTVILGKHYMQA